uniref:Si:ch211-215e19.6 n=1 Tax=Cyprinus carpio TaxID=7962 RepID=A0A8C1KEE5_CYPCA
MEFFYGCLHFSLHLILSADGAGIQKMNIGVKSGSPGIMPCLYDKKHKENRKYWCQGSLWFSCSILAYANKSGKYSLTDYPAQSIFTVQWKNMKTSDSGYYWCAVEIGGKIDDGYYLYLTVQSSKNIKFIRTEATEKNCNAPPQFVMVWINLINDCRIK